MKDSYGYPDSIPIKNSDLYNDAGYLNEGEVDEKIGDAFNLDDATDGQIMTCVVQGTSKGVTWVDNDEWRTVLDIDNATDGSILTCYDDDGTLKFHWVVPNA